MQNLLATNTARVLGGALSACLLLGTASPSPARTASSFAGFQGAWTGGGYIELASGSREKVRCQASYATEADGASMKLDVACASDSYAVKVVSNVAAGPDGGLSGSWQELTRQVSGDVSGRVSAPGQIQASLDGAPYPIKLSLSTTGRRQMLAMQVPGSDVESVSIEMRKV